MLALLPLQQVYSQECTPQGQGFGSCSNIYGSTSTNSVKTVQSTAPVVTITRHVALLIRPIFFFL
jgi:hypothetical protein